MGCLSAIFIVWNFQGAGRGWAALSAVQGRSEQAWQQISLAQAALADSKLADSQEALAQAEVLLGEAKQELDTSLAASRYILRWLDVTGTVQSGQDLLLLGESLTRAGQAATRALAPLLATGQTSGELETKPPEDNLVSAIQSAQLEFIDVLTELKTAERLAQSINSPFLPAEIKEQLASVRASLPKARASLQKFSEQSATYLYLLGAQQDRQYLILFANNDELRPTGGFIGTLGLVNVDRGRVENIDVQSVYDPDGQLQEFIAPPAPLQSIVNRWYLRDANWFVDYSVNARKIADLFEKEGGPTVDGVILMTPDVIARLLAITGPIKVPGYDVAVSADNFVIVTQGQVTYGYDKELNKPKQFLADLTPILLNKLFAGSGEASASAALDSKLKVISALSEALQAKDLLLYFRDEQAQNQLEQVGWGGIVPRDVPGFLSVNNANIGGHKSDQFIEQEIDYRGQLEADGDVDVVLTIRRQHRGPEEEIDFDYPPNENPAWKNNVVYQRVLVPANAELIEAKGFASAADIPAAVIPATDLPVEADPAVAAWQQPQRPQANGTVIGQESGYTFFANWLITQPGQTSVALYRYRLPKATRLPSTINPAGSYSLFVFKQPGAKRTTVRATLSLPEQYRIIHTVPASGVTAEANSSIVYRGLLNHDLLVGLIMGKAP